MTETANQLLSRVVPVCTWQVLDSTATTEPDYPRFLHVVREWRFFNRSVNISIRHTPGGQFPVFPINTGDLYVENDANHRFYSNVLWPVETLLGGARFNARSTGILGVPDLILCTNNPTTGKMPVEVKTRHNLRLGNHNLWEVYRHADRARIADQDLKFRKKILSQTFGEMACNGLHYGILTNYSDTYFLKRLETEPTTLYVSRVIHPNSTNPTLRECVYYISRLAINDTVGNRLDRVMDDNISSYDDDDGEDDDNEVYPDDDPDDDYIPPGSSSSKKRKSSPIQTGSKKRAIASSSKGITTIGEYIGSGTFGKVFSGYYDGQSVAWKTCDAYKEQEAMKMLKHEAHIYSILKECQGTNFFYS
jgi:hypothetical protein